MIAASIALLATLAMQELLDGEYRGDSAHPVTGTAFGSNTDDFDRLADLPRHCDDDADPVEAESPLADIVRDRVEPDELRSRADITPSIRRRLKAHGESARRFDEFQSHRAETARLVGELPVHRFHEALRSCRYSIDRFVDDRIATRGNADVELRSKAITLLRPLGQLVVETRRTWWRVRIPELDHDASYADRIARDAAVRQLWLALDEHFASRLRDADKRFGGLLTRSDPAFPK